MDGIVERSCFAGTSSHPRVSFYFSPSFHPRSSHPLVSFYFFFHPFSLSRSFPVAFDLRKLCCAPRSTNRRQSRFLLSPPRDCWLWPTRIAVAATTMLDCSFSGEQPASFCRRPKRRSRAIIVKSLVASLMTPRSFPKCNRRAPPFAKPWWRRRPCTKPCPLLP